MTRRLALDTSGIEYAMLLLVDGRCVGSVTWTRSPGRDTPMVARLADLLRSADWIPKHLDAVAAGRGPGSFTGLRVGLSVAAGLAYGRQIPLYLLDSLEALAVRDQERRATAVLRDAGRNEVYAWRAREGAVRLAVPSIDAWLRPDDRVVVEPVGGLRRWSPSLAGLEVPADQQRPLSEALVLTANDIFERAKPVRYDELQALYSQPAAAEERRGKQP